VVLVDGEDVYHTQTRYFNDTFPRLAYKAPIREAVESIEKELRRSNSVFGGIIFMGTNVGDQKKLDYIVGHSPLPQDN
jgi:hypothetical protein